MAKNEKQTPPGLPLSGEEQRPVAYHAGPPEIGFCGREWVRGVAQPVTAEEWTAMQARADFDEFKFIEEK